MSLLLPALLLRGDCLEDPVIRGGGGLSPKGPGSITERSPVCGVHAWRKPSQARIRQLFCACHSSQKGGCVARRSRSMLVERPIGRHCHKRETNGRDAKVNRTGGDYMWVSFV